MGPESIAGVVGLLLALVLAVRALQDHRGWERWLKKREEDGARRKDGDGSAGPWGG